MSESLAILFEKLVPPEFRRLAAGDAVFRDGDLAENVFAVKSGQVRLVRFTPEGERLTLYRAGAGETFAEPALFGGRYHCSAQADTTGVIACHNRQALLDRLTTDPVAMCRYAELLSRQVRDLRMRLELRSIRSADERILFYLRITADPTTGVVHESSSRKEMAIDLGLAHETFYRRLAALEEQGLITREKERIVLLRQGKKDGLPALPLFRGRGA